jgi:hypothetical protein
MKLGFAAKPESRYSGLFFMPKIQETPEKHLLRSSGKARARRK